MEDFVDIVKKFKDQKVLVVGDLMLDEYIFGDVERISPEAPIPVLNVKEVKFVPGGAANTAWNVKSLGGEVILCGLIGIDEKGKILKKILCDRNIDINGLIEIENRKTTVKTRAVARNQHVVRIDFEEKTPISLEIENRVIDFIRGQINKFNIIIISDYVKGFVTPNLVKNIIKIARENTIFCLIDPKGEDCSKYKGCNIITPNKKEMAQSLNLPLNKLDEESGLIQAGKMFLSSIMSDGVLITRGEEGMTLLKNTGEVFHYPAVNKKVIDVSGAGDTAIATFALSFVAGADFKAAMEIASHACGISIGKVGTAIVTPEELKEALIKRINYDSKET